LRRNCIWDYANKNVRLALLWGTDPNDQNPLAPGNKYAVLQDCPVYRAHTVNCEIRIYETIILPVVLYGCETWSLTLREEHKLRVFQNRVLRRIFGPKRDEVTGEWRKLHNKELHDLYSSPSIITTIKSRRIRLAGHVA
jgi:hypothetical protein